MKLGHRPKAGHITAVLLAAAGGLFELTPRYDLTVVQQVQAMAARHEHGWDDQLPPALLDQVARERQIRSTCGYVAPWVVSVLEREGVEARVVETVTLDAWDARNDGHVLVEARVAGEWVLFDVDRDVWFWRDGRPLSFVGFVEAVADGDYEVRPLSGDPTDPVSEIRRDDRRLIQVPMIRDGEGTWFFSSDPERVESYSPTFRELSRAEWLERFYAA